MESETANPTSPEASKEPMKARIATLGALFLSFAATQLLAQSQPVSEQPAAEVRPVKESVLPYRPVGEPVLRLLRKRVDSVDWNEVTFEDVLDWLRDQSDGQVNVVAAWKALSPENVTPETLVTVSMSHVTVAEVLDEVINELSEERTIGYHGFENKIKFSSRSDFDRHLYVRVYDVTDLLFRVPNFGQGAPQIDLQQTKSSTSGGGSGQSVFSGGSSGGREQEEGGTQAETRIEQELDKLRQRIKITIAPESWREVQQVQGLGGGRGEIEIIQHSLVITNTIEVHEQIAGRFVAHTFDR